MHLEYLVSISSYGLIFCVIQTKKFVIISIVGVSSLYNSVNFLLDAQKASTVFRIAR